MKKSLATITGALIILILSCGLSLAGNGNGNGNGGSGNFAQKSGQGSMNAGIDQLAYEEPNEAEIEALTYMVEEEKLARDVYNVLYDTWEIPAFANIARAEQRHMDAIISLLDKYSLENPADSEPGLFNDKKLQELYDKLIADGKVSEKSALLVGATIEDLDISDLLVELEQVDNLDIIRVFENLLRGSENHLRAFSSLLAVYGFQPYEAQFLTQEQIEEILSSPRTRGGNRRGNRDCANSQTNCQMIDANGDGICDLQQQ